jgi:hypothetical protein
MKHLSDNFVNMVLTDIPYNEVNAIWERLAARGADNVWIYYGWHRISLTPAAEKYVYNEQKILWGANSNSGSFMTGDQTANLSEPVSEQRHGIVLAFCYYNGTGDTNWEWHLEFVPKYMIGLTTSRYCFSMFRGCFSYAATKNLYISDTQIRGHDDNNKTGTANGITYANNKFVLRYVFGV